MLVLIVVLLALIPAVAILYPFVRSTGREESMDDEGSTAAELARRWEAALAGLKNAELERALGNLAEEDYRWLREQHMTEAAQVMKAMELEDGQGLEMLSALDREVGQVRRRALGHDGADPDPTDE